MENYRRKLTSRIIILTVLGIGLAVVFAGYHFSIIESRAPEIVSEFQQSLIGVLSLMCFLISFRYLSCLQQPRKLKQLFNQETDERKKMIKQHAGMPMTLISSSLMILAGIIAGYYNVTVFYTLIAAGMVQLTIGAILKVVFLRIYT